MTDPHDITLERVKRLSEAMADLMESHASQGRLMMKQLTRMDERLTGIEANLASLAKDVRELASEQALLGNRVENAFARALRANIRLDEIEDEAGGGDGG